MGKKLHNKTDKRVLKKQMLDDPDNRVTLSFYQYANIGNVRVFRDHLYIAWESLGVMGRTYVASEGINAQISVPEKNWGAFKAQMDSITFLKGIRLNIAIQDDGKSFYKLIIRIKNKILADGLNDDTFDVTNGGQHLSAKEFNSLAEQPDTIIVDMRNHYESEVGHFQNAITPDVETFRDSLPIIEDQLQEHKEKNIIMYCTGGIRCEKASAWYKHKGFKNVFQLDGGIIEYTRQVKNSDLENKFIGKNFVFDERMGERISKEIISNCYQCDVASDRHSNCTNLACHRLIIQCESCADKWQGACCETCYQYLQLPEGTQKELRKGIKDSMKTYHKSRTSPFLENKALQEKVKVLFSELEK